MDSITQITTSQLTLESLYGESSMSYNLVEIETCPKDMCKAYQKNKNNDEDKYEFLRTVLVVDEGAASEEFYKKILFNIKKVHTVSNDKLQELEGTLFEPYVHLVAQTQQYWDDVRYHTDNRRTYLAESVYQYDMLKVKVFERIRDIFYDRDLLVDICLEESPSKSKLDMAVEIIRKQKIDFSKIKPILSKNSYINGVCEKIALKNNLFEILDEKISYNKKQKL